MNYQIFPGLSQPKSELYFDLQSMIAANGGRIHLAEILECEWVKSYLPKQQYQKRFKVPRWSKLHEQVIIDNWGKVKSGQIYLLLRYCKTRNAVNQKIYYMRKVGKIPRDIKD